MEWPPIPRELVEYLDKTNPIRIPKPGKTLEQLMFEAGQRHMVEVIIQQYRIQNPE